MSEPVSSGAAGGLVLVKFFGGAAAASAVAVALGFLFMWPKTLKEAFIRIVCTIFASTFFGPVAVLALHASWPGLFASAANVAGQAGVDPFMGTLVLAAPVLVLAGLPAWWIIGGFVRWFDKRKHKDIGQMANDVKKLFSVKE